MTEQKFWRGHRIRVARDKFEAIVVGSYSDLHQSQSRPVYALVQLRGETGVNWLAWFEEAELSLIDADRDKGEAILQAYKQQ